MKIKKIVLGYSVLSEYRKCPSKFNFRYLKQLTKPSTPSTYKGSPLTFGSLVHEFMEFYHNGIPVQEVLDQVLGKGSLSALSEVDPAGQRSLLHLELILNKYIEAYPDPKGEFTPYDKLEDKKAFEYECDFILSTNPLIVWRQHYDGLVNLPEGTPAILEHKTSSGDLRKDLRNRMLPNAQAVGYVYGARRALGIPVSGVLFNGLCTYRPLVNPGYKFRGQGTPQPLFLRELVKVDDWMLDEWLSQTLRDVKRMIEDIEQNTFGANAPDACTVFNQLCQYADMCRSSPKDRITLEEYGYEKEGWKGFELEFEKESEK